MTHCVQMQDVGVLAQTSASPADTSAVDEPVWTPATFMKGELCMCVYTSTQPHQHNSVSTLGREEMIENMGTLEND